MQPVSQALPHKSVPIRDGVSILEALGKAASNTEHPVRWTEDVRLSWALAGPDSRCLPRHIVEAAGPARDHGPLLFVRRQAVPQDIGPVEKRRLIDKLIGRQEGCAAAAA